MNERPISLSNSCLRGEPDANIKGPVVMKGPWFDCVIGCLSPNSDIESNIRRSRTLSTHKVQPVKLLFYLKPLRLWCGFCFMRDVYPQESKMRQFDLDFTKSFSSFEDVESERVRGANDWSVPWADLMMVMFVLFVVLFMYASTHKDVKILFSQQSADQARETSTLDPLIGLIGQISSRVDQRGSQEIVRVAENQVLYRSRADGVSVVRESAGRIRITLRGDLFFAEKDGVIQPESNAYLQEIAEIVRLSVGSVHVVGYASESEAVGTESFTLSSQRAASVADYLIHEFQVEPKRIEITGRGAYSPELPGTNPNNKAMNRRVEIIITNAS